MSIDNDFAVIREDECPNVLVPWKNAFGGRVLTCSPVRRGAIICMDPECRSHEGEYEQGVRNHAGCVKATSLEQVVINGFTNLDPMDAVGSREFTGWTFAEISFACSRTDDVKATKLFMFDGDEMPKKLKTLVSTFDGAARIYQEVQETIHRDGGYFALCGILDEWRGEMDALSFLHVMKARLDTCNRKVALLTNSVEIWKSDAIRAKSELERLKQAIKLLRKSSKTK